MGCKPNAPLVSAHFDHKQLVSYSKQGLSNSNACVLPSRLVLNTCSISKTSLKIAKQNDYTKRLKWAGRVQLLPFSKSLQHLVAKHSSLTPSQANCRSPPGVCSLLPHPGSHRSTPLPLAPWAMAARWKKTGGVHAHIWVGRKIYQVLIFRDFRYETYGSCFLFCKKNTLGSCLNFEGAIGDALKS